METSFGPIYVQSQENVLGFECESVIHPNHVEFVIAPSPAGGGELLRSQR